MLPHDTTQEAIEKAIEESGFKIGADGDLDLLYVEPGKVRKSKEIVHARAYVNLKPATNQDAFIAALSAFKFGGGKEITHQVLTSSFQKVPRAKQRWESR